MSTADLGSLAELAARVEAEVRGDGTCRIERIAAINEAAPGVLTFATDARYLRAALDSRASAVLIDARLLGAAGDTRMPLLVVDSARIALARLLTSFAVEPERVASRHPSAVVDPTAHIGERVSIGPLVYIGPRARIGDGTILEAGAFVGADAVLGRDCRLFPRSVLLDRCIAGDRVVLQPGAVIGSDGFGYVPVEGTLFKIPQVGIVELGDDVEIGANTCVDRAQTGVTRIGNETKLDNLIQIGHNVSIGMKTVIAGQAGVAGSARIGHGVQIGGKTGVNGHISIGSGVRIAGNSQVWQSVPDGATLSGDPAQDHRLELRKKVHLKNLPKLFARVTALEKQAND